MQGAVSEAPLPGAEAVQAVHLAACTLASVTACASATCLTPRQLAASTQVVARVGLPMLQGRADDLQAKDGVTLPASGRTSRAQTAILLLLKAYPSIVVGLAAARATVPPVGAQDATVPPAFGALPQPRCGRATPASPDWGTKKCPSCGLKCPSCSLTHRSRE